MAEIIARQPEQCIYDINQSLHFYEEYPIRTILHYKGAQRNQIAGRNKNKEKKQKLGCFSELVPKLNIQKYSYKKTKL
jgi:hypothetical protein